MASGPNHELGRMDRWREALTGWYLRLAASGMVPARWYLRTLPPPEQRAARQGRLQIEIVSHCWNYAHLLAYQLSSLVQFPPRQLGVTMTVFHSLEDLRSVALLEYFAARQVPGVTWNWQALPREQLFRRAIGRNMAAKATRADWIWFTDCDVMFRDDCLDGLAAALQDRRDVLVHPREERISRMYRDDDPLLTAAAGQPRLVDIDPGQFSIKVLHKATGPMQIAHGDVARACGYCEGIRFYQTPSARWRKTYEDTAFRWLLRSQGTAVDAPPPYRIRHVSKGRYTGSRPFNHLRSWIRRTKSRWLGR